LQLPAADARVDDALIEALRSPTSGDVAFGTANALVELRASGAPSPDIVLVAGGASAELLEAWRKEAKHVSSLRALPSPVFALLEEAGQSLAPGGLQGSLLGAGAAVLDGRGRTTPLGVSGDLQIDGQRSGLKARRLASGALDVSPASAEWLSLGAQRFEAGAVASVVAKHPAVGSVHVSVETAGADGLRLVCYVVPRDGASFTETELRRQARSSLPAALVPHAFVELSALPIDAAGKLDAKRLPSPFAAPAAAYVAPRSESEKQLARMFVEVLNVPRVGVHDNFFDLGGQSLLCLRVIDMIERETKCRLSPRILLLNTLEQAASALDQLRGQSPAVATQTKPAEPTGVAGRVIKGLRGLLRG
jgi:AMP-binding enzyme C-terminal domain/Phosphopantetheine attachment site